MKTLFITLLTIVLSTFSIQAQIKTQLTQHLANPAHLYPALSGWHGGTSVNANFRNQWPGIPAAWVSYLVGFDHYSNKYKTAISGNFSHDRQGTGVINTNRADLSISPKIALKNGLIIMPSVSAHSFQISIDYDQIIFGSAPVGTGVVYPTGNTPVSTNQNYLSVGGGIALTYRDGFVAFQMNEIDNPKPLSEPKSAGFSGIPRNINAVIGKVFKMRYFKVTPTLTYWNYAVFHQLMLGISGQYKRWSLGSRFAPNNFIGFSTGYNIADRFRLGYNYDATISRLGTQTLGSHELSLRLMLRKKQATRFISELPQL